MVLKHRPGTALTYLPDCRHGCVSRRTAVEAGLTVALITTVSLGAAHPKGTQSRIKQR
jgi:hypothetical protein